MTRSYSHKNEDWILRQLFPYQTGIYLDIGGNDPTYWSNTAIFYEAGWRGLVVEPQPFAARKFREARPRDVTVQCALSDVAGVLTMQQGYQNDMCCSAAENWQARGTTAIKVQARRLDELLAEYPAIRSGCDFVSLDVEGWEKHVLDGADFTTFRPAAWCIEARAFNPLRRMWREWEPILLKAGYRFLCSDFLNRYYVHPDYPEIMTNAEELWDSAA